MSAATMPTKNAAMSSMPSMNRSIALRLRGGGEPASFRATSASPRTFSATTISGWRKPGSLRPARKVKAAQPRRGRTAVKSERSLVFGELVLELFHDRVGIAAAFSHIVGPFLLERLCSFFPFRDLCRRKRIDFVASLGLDLGYARVLEVGPRCRDLAGPFVIAVIVDRLFLPRRHLVVFVFVEHKYEGRHVQGNVHVILGNLVDAE